MLGAARELIEPAEQRVLFYGYCDDVASTHAEPFCNPGGEFRLTDPDGYSIWIAQI